jgi:hypothetical protein
VTPFKRQMPGGNFVIDNGAGRLLDACPCCALPFNDLAADKVLAKIASNEMTFDAAVAWLDLIRSVGKE